MNTSCNDFKVGYRSGYKGQSLVEIGLVAPVLLIILLAAFWVGMAMFNGNVASNAIKEPTVHKMEMAADMGEIGDGALHGMIQGPETNIKVDSPLDSLVTVDVSGNSKLIVGEKNFTVTLPATSIDFNMAVSQGIQKQLLDAVLAPISPPGLLPAPPKLKPTERTDLGIIPSTLVFVEGLCAMEPEGGKGTVNTLAPNGSPATGQTYTSRDERYLGDTPFVESSLLKLAPQFYGECTAEVGDGGCSAEAANLMPSEEPAGPPHVAVTASGATATKTYTNPPGAPGKILTAVAECQGVGNACAATIDFETPTYSIGDMGFTENPATAPPHGLYFDRSGQYVAPPGDFVPSCIKRKVAECQTLKARELALDIVAEFNIEHCWTGRL